MSAVADGLCSPFGYQSQHPRTPQRTHQHHNAEHLNVGTTEQLDLSGLPVILDSRGTQRSQTQTRPRLRDFLKPTDAETAQNAKKFHYPFGYPFTHHVPASPQFGPLHLESYPTEPTQPADESHSEKPSSEHPSIPLPPFMISLRNFITRFILEWWILELLSWVISALCMCSLVIVFAYYDKQKIPQWHFGLTLNALISVLAGIAKSALLVPTFEALGQLKWNWFRSQPRIMIDFEVFDSASRGPWGSLMLLTRTHGKNLASLGAFVVIASLPLSLFFQQIVTYPERWQPVSGVNSSLPRVITYGNSQLEYSVNGTAHVDGDDYLEAAVASFFYGNGTEIDFGVGCPTGNCTWEPYESLAVCGACADVSNLLSYTCLSAPGDWLGNVTELSLNVSSYPPVYACGYYLNATGELPVLMNGFAGGPSGPGDALSLRLLPLSDTTTRQPLYGSGSINFKDVRNPIADFIAVGTNGGTSAVYQNATPEANECILHWCTKTFTPTYQWGQLNENPTNIFYDSGPPTNPWFPHKNAEGTMVNDYLATFNLTPPVQHPSDANITYGLANVTALEVLLLFDVILPSYITSNVTSTPLFRTFNAVYMGGPPRSRIAGNVGWAPPNNITTYVQRLADAMTHSVRANSNETVTAWGQALMGETYVHVRWEWIILPVLILFISLIFIVATVLKSSSEMKEVGIWKTSALAALMNGLDEPVQRRVGALTKMSDVRTAAERLKVRIVPDEV